MSVQPSKIDGIMQWFDTMGVSLERSIDIRQMPEDSEAIGVFANNEIAEGDLIACVPKDAVISIVNTAAADILAASDLRGGLALNFALMYEQYVMGPKSKW